MGRCPISRSRTHLRGLCKLKKTTNCEFQARNRDIIQDLLEDGQSEFESRQCISQRIDRWIAGDSQFGFDSVQFGLHSEIERKDIARSVDRCTKSADHRRLSGFSVSFRGYGGSESHASGCKCLLEWLCVTNFPNNQQSIKNASQVLISRGSAGNVDTVMYSQQIIIQFYRPGRCLPPDG
jgi:hypothetical protein